MNRKALLKILSFVLVIGASQFAFTQALVTTERTVQHEPSEVFDASLRAVVVHNWSLVDSDSSALILSFECRPYSHLRQWIKPELCIVTIARRESSSAVMIETRFRNKTAAWKADYLEEWLGRFIADIEKEIGHPSVDSAKKLVASHSSQKKTVSALPSQPDPPSIKIVATSERLKSALVSRYAHNGFAIAADSAYQLVFWKDVPAKPDFVGTLLFGRSVPAGYRFTNTFVFAPSKHEIEVVAMAEASIQDGYGNWKRYLVTNDPKVRSDLLNSLQDLKTDLENTLRDPE